MAREDHRDAPVARLSSEHVREHVHPDRVQPRERLIEDQDVGLVDERGCQLDALLVPQRQGLHAIVRITDDLEELEELRGARARHALGRAAQACQVHQLLAHAHLRIEPAFLGHVAEAPSGDGVDGPSSPFDLAGVGVEHPERDAHRRRLARPVAPDEPHDPSLGDLERHAIERDDVVEPTAKIDQLEHGRSQDRRGRTRTGTPPPSRRRGTGRGRPR